jgi:hypothetical protein
MNAPKLCKDCRWIDCSQGLELARCSHPTSRFHLAVHPVSGATDVGFQISCWQVRQLSPPGDDTAGGLPTDPCGPDGKHWEPVPPVGFV